jgi:hypothetical protein
MHFDQIINLFYNFYRRIICNKCFFVFWQQANLNNQVKLLSACIKNQENNDKSVETDKKLF